MKMIAFILSAIILTGGCVETQKTQSAATEGKAATSSGTAKEAIEYIIFGKFTGRCLGGRCSPMYKFDQVNKKLSLDNSNHYSEGAELAFTEMLTSEQYSIAAGLVSKIPDSLFLAKEEKFGCPNCVDQGGYYFSIKTNSKKYSFEIDTKTDAISSFLRPFAEELGVVINKLRAIKQITVDS